MVSILVAAALLSSYRDGTAAAAAAKDDVAHLYQLDFSVPDTPAFQLLETDPSSILRPSTVRELSAAASSFTGSGTSITLPRSFGIEFSPALLLNGAALSMKQYQANAWLYRFRLSGATHRLTGDGTPTSVAVGIRLSVADGTDLRTNPQYSSLLRNVLTGMATTVVQGAQAVQDAVLSVADEYKVDLDVEKAAAIADSLVAAKGSPDLWEQALSSAGFNTEATQAVLQLALLPQRTGEVSASKAEIRRWVSSIEEKLWNAQAIDVAFAARGSAADSTGRALKLDRLSGWVTYSNGFGSWGQILVGGQAGAIRDSTQTYDTFGSLSARLYAGRNARKVFIEIQDSFEDGRLPSVLVNSGAEWRASSGLWLTPTFGLRRDATSSKWDLKTSLAVKFGTTQ